MFKKCLKKEMATIRSCSSVLHKPVKFYAHTPASQQTHMYTSHNSPANSCDQTIMCVHNLIYTADKTLIKIFYEHTHTHTHISSGSNELCWSLRTHIFLMHFVFLDVPVADIMLMKEWATRGVVLQWFYHTEVKAVAAFRSLFAHPRFLASHSFSILAC